MTSKSVTTWKGSHDNQQNIGGLYGDAEVIQVPDNTVLEAPAPEAAAGADFITLAPAMPLDPRLKWSLDEDRAAALETIADQAEEYRERFVTGKAGRIAGYRAKARVAERIQAATKPDAADVQALAVEAEARGLTVQQLADIILDRARRFESMAGLIDGLKARAKTAVRFAGSPNDVWRAVEELRARAEASLAES